MLPSFRQLNRAMLTQAKRRSISCKQQFRSIVGGGARNLLHHRKGSGGCSLQEMTNKWKSREDGNGRGNEFAKRKGKPSVCTVHRVDTTLPRDDYITEKTLTASAANRLGKRTTAFYANEPHKKSTEEHFSMAERDAGFYGSYANVRRKLDYSYHVHYRKERQWLHDAIIEDNLLKHQQQDDDSDAIDYHQGKPVILPRYPWLILMVGVHGAAKHSTVRQLIDTGRLKLLSLVCVDTDDLRRYLPEYATYRDACPSSVDRRTRKEAGYISETLTIAALQAGRNVIFYGSLKDTAWYKDTFIPFLRKQFHGIQVALIHVMADPAVAFARAQQRAVATRRTLQEKEFMQQLSETIPRACQLIQPAVNYYAEIRNNPSRDLELLNDGGDWNKFTRVFDQQGSVLSLSYPDHKIEMSNPIVHTHHRRVSYIRRISAVASSEENHLADDMEFYGPFAKIRKTLDYSFHRNYTFERQHFQDAIIREFLEAAEESSGQNRKGCDRPTRPWAIFTGTRTCYHTTWCSFPLHKLSHSIYCRSRSHGSGQRVCVSRKDSVSGSDSIDS
jgi:predicted kinase